MSNFMLHSALLQTVASSFNSWLSNIRSIQNQSSAGSGGGDCDGINIKSMQKKEFLNVNDDDDGLIILEERDRENTSFYLCEDSSSEDAEMPVQQNQLMQMEMKNFSPEENSLFNMQQSHNQPPIHNHQIHNPYQQEHMEKEKNKIENKNCSTTTTTSIPLARDVSTHGNSGEHTNLEPVVEIPDSNNENNCVDSTNSTDSMDDDSDDRRVETQQPKNATGSKKRNYDALQSLSVNDARNEQEKSSDDSGNKSKKINTSLHEPVCLDRSVCKDQKGNLFQTLEIMESTQTSHDYLTFRQALLKICPIFAVECYGEECIEELESKFLSQCRKLWYEYLARKIQRQFSSSATPVPSEELENLSYRYYSSHNSSSSLRQREKGDVDSKKQISGKNDKRKYHSFCEPIACFVASQLMQEKNNEIRQGLETSISLLRQYDTAFISSFLNWTNPTHFTSNSITTISTPASTDGGVDTTNSEKI